MVWEEGKLALYHVLFIEEICYQVENVHVHS